MGRTAAVAFLFGLVACSGQQEATKVEMLEIRALLAEDNAKQQVLATAQTEANAKRQELVDKINAIYARTGRDRAKWNMDLKTGTFTPVVDQKKEPAKK